MTVRVQWDDERQRVIRYDVEGDWTWAEIMTAFDQVIAMQGGVAHHVDVIVNLVRSSGIPRGVLEQVKRMTDHLPPNQGTTVYVGERAVLQAFAHGFQRIYPEAAKGFSFDFCGTVEEARERLHRPDSPDESPG